MDENIKALQRLAEYAIRADAVHQEAKAALAEAREAENKASCAAINAWNAFHKKLLEMNSDGLKASDLGIPLKLRPEPVPVDY